MLGGLWPVLLPADCSFLPAVCRWLVAAEEPGFNVQRCAGCVHTGVVMLHAPLLWDGASKCDCCSFQCTGVNTAAVAALLLLLLLLLLLCAQATTGGAPAGGFKGGFQGGFRK
jgi:hypothetical protein